MEGYSIKVSDLHVSFWVSNHGIHSFKDFAMTLGLKSPFQRREVLRGIDLEIKRGECFALVGRNGSGKSTLLRTLAGIIRPEKGSIDIRGTIAPLLAIGSGLEPELSGYDNIRVLGTLIGFSNREIKDLTAGIREFSELTDDDLSMAVKRYSAGMMARLAFSISVARIPDILIVDEALSVGDAGFQQKCADRINEIKASGCSIVYVSHSIPELERICTRGACLVDGKVAYLGDMNSVGQFYNSLFSHH